MAKYIILFFISFIQTIFLYGQKKLMCPVKDGYFLKNDFDSSFVGKIIQPDPGIKIYGKKSYVYAMDSGIVRNIDNIGDVHFIVLQTKDHFISLSALDTLFVKKNDKVRKGQIIGRMYENMVYVMLFKENGVVCEASRLIDCKEQ